MIAKFTKSKYTHVGLIVAHDDLTGETTIIEADRFIKTGLNQITLDDKVHVVFTTGEKSVEIKERIVKSAMEKIGTGYDYMQILGLFISLILKGSRYEIFDNSNRMICSELIDIAYLKAGVKRKNMDNLGNVTPQELLESYSFRMIEREV